MKKRPEKPLNILADAIEKSLGDIYGRRMGFALLCSILTAMGNVTTFQIVNEKTWLRR